MFRSNSSAAPSDDSNSNRRRRNQVVIPIKRIPGEMKTQDDQIVKCRILLNDLSSSGVSLFAESQIPIGDKVTLVLEQPRHLFLKGDVLWCNMYNLHSTVISAESYLYRAGIKFNFATAEEAAEFRKYCDSLQLSQR